MDIQEAPAQNLLPVRTTATKRGTNVPDQPLYLLYYTLCKLFLFLKVKSAPIGSRIGFGGSSKAEASKVLKNLSENNLQYFLSHGKSTGSMFGEHIRLLIG